MTCTPEQMENRANRAGTDVWRQDVASGQTESGLVQRSKWDAQGAFCSLSVVLPSCLGRQTDVTGEKCFALYFVAGLAAR